VSTETFVSPTTKQCHITEDGDLYFTAMKSSSFIPGTLNISLTSMLHTHSSTTDVILYNISK